MEREKQINEMAKDLCLLSNTSCSDCKMKNHCLMRNCAECFYKQGYRKERQGEVEKAKQEVAKEIFEELKQDLNYLIAYYREKRKYVTEVKYNEFEQRFCDIKIKTFEERLLKIAELKKKYIGE